MQHRKLTFLTPIIFFSAVVALSPFAYAYADGDDDLDLEFDFSVRQKSTIENFPFKEIDQAEMSNAAIAGALQATSRTASSQTGKPIFIEKQEKDEKQQKIELELDDNPLSEEDLIRFGQLQLPTPQLQSPRYQQDTGRTYTAHNTTTVERP